MAWEASASSSSFRKESELMSSVRHNPSPPWHNSYSSAESDSKHIGSPYGSSVELCASAPQRDLYSPINDSSSSVNSGSVTTPPSRCKKRARQTSSSSSVSSSSSSSASSSSSSSLPPCLAPDSHTATPLKHRRKDSDLSDGEIASGSSDERYRYENLPKAVRKYQVPSSRELSPLSSQTSDGSSRNRRHRTRLSASVASEEQRSLTSSLCSQRKQSHTASPHSKRPPRKRQRTRSKRSASPEVRKIMLHARDKQQLSDEESRGDEQSLTRQRSRSYLNANLSASSVSSKSFSDDQPSPPPSPVSAPAPAQLSVDRPCTSGDQDAGIAHSASAISEERKSFSMSSVLLRGTSPVSDGEFEQLDKDGEVSKGEGLMSSPEEGQRSPSPIPPNIEDSPLERRSPISSPPQLHAVSVAVKSRRQLASLSLDGILPWAESLSLPVHQDENAGSPYPPPPVLSAERSPLPVRMNREGSFPVPPLLELQAVDSQVSKSSPCDDLMPPLPGSPYPPAPPRSPASDRPGVHHIKDSSAFVTEPDADTGQPATQLTVDEKCGTSFTSPSLPSLQPPSPPPPETDQKCASSLSSSYPLAEPILPQVLPSTLFNISSFTSVAAEDTSTSLDASTSASGKCAQVIVATCSAPALNTTDYTQSPPTLSRTTLMVTTPVASVMVSEPLKSPSLTQSCNSRAPSLKKHPQSLPECKSPSLGEQSYEHSGTDDCALSSFPDHLSPKPASPNSGCPSHQPALPPSDQKPVKGMSPDGDQSPQRFTSSSPSQQSCLAHVSLRATSTTTDQQSDKSAISDEPQESPGFICTTQDQVLRLQPTHDGGPTLTSP